MESSQLGSVSLLASDAYKHVQRLLTYNTSHILQSGYI